jgi:hypothetical protein
VARRSQLVKQTCAIAFGRNKEPAQTPIEAASIAIAHGRQIFHVSLELDDQTDETVEGIEQLGLRLDQVSYVFMPTDTKVNASFGGTGYTKQNGKLVGVYLFRR